MPAPFEYAGPTPVWAETPASGGTAKNKKGLSPLPPGGGVDPAD